IVLRDVWCVVVLFFFFFSSRRRHTRWPRDWSSDVCSSDLSGGRELLAPREIFEPAAGSNISRGARSSRPPDRPAPWPGRTPSGRSEERRVGKRGSIGGRRSA